MSLWKTMGLLPLLIAGSAAQSNQIKPYLRIESNQIATVRGEVEANIQGCSRDRACYLVLSIEGVTVNVVYSPAEGAGSLVDPAQSHSAIAIPAGATIEARGAYTKANNIYTLDVFSSKEYWVRVVPTSKK